MPWYTDAQRIFRPDWMGRTNAAVGAIGTLGGLAFKGLEYATRPKPLGFGALAQHAGMLAGGALALKGVGMLSDSIKLQQSYSKMLQVYPELQREKPEKVRLYFDSIAQGSPSTAENPLVVGNLIKRFIAYDGVDHGAFKDLISAQGTIDAAARGAESNAINFIHHGLSLAHAYGRP